MPARNIHHDAVVEALKADGWTVTHDPLRLLVGRQPVYVDLGAERDAIGAEKGGRFIAVEIQSFLGPSVVRDLQEALGQYILYRMVLKAEKSERALYMALHEAAYEEVFTEKLGQLALSETPIKVLVFDPVSRRVSKWIE